MSEKSADYDALTRELRRAHAMSVSDPTDASRRTLYGRSADAIEALIARANSPEVSEREAGI